MAPSLRRMAAVARRHHTVPRFYLGNFAEAGQVGTVMLPGEKRFNQSVKNASATTDFYALGQVNTEGSDAFEKGLSTLEREAARVIRLVLNGTWPLGADDRAVVAEFVAVQYLRGPDRRVQVQNTASQFVRMDIALNGKEWMAERLAENSGSELDDEQIDRLWEQATRIEGPPLTVSPGEDVKQIVDLLPDVYWHFAARRGRSFGSVGSVSSRATRPYCSCPTLTIPNGRASVFSLPGGWLFLCPGIQRY